MSMWCVINFIDQVHRCRNRGGTDITICSATQKFNPDVVFTTAEVDDQKDIICGEYKPLARYCHISALNDASLGQYFQFTKYQYFNAEDAHTTCAEVGGEVPSLTSEVEALQLHRMITNLLEFVSLGWPYSLKWMTWPVSIGFTI